MISVIYNYELSYRKIAIVLQFRNDQLIKFNHFVVTLYGVPKDQHKTKAKACSKVFVFLYLKENIASYRTV